MVAGQLKTRRSKRSWKQRALFGIFLYLGAIGVLVLFERMLLFPAPSVGYGNWQAGKFGAQETFIGNGNAKVHVWSLLKKNSNRTLIVCHGNGETLGVMGDELAAIRERWNVHVVAFDFRGYGKTGGLANEADILSDAVAVANWVREHESFRGKPMIVLGRSLGGAAAIEIATKSQVDGLILDRTFSSIVDVAAARYFMFPVRWLMRNPFRSIEKFPSYKGPLLQMHGDVDEVVPYRFGKKLFEASNAAPKTFLSIPGLSHNDAWPDAFWTAGKTFMEEIEAK